MAYGMRQSLYQMDENVNHQHQIEILEDDCRQLHDELKQEKMRYEKLNEQINENNDNFKSIRNLRNDVDFLRSSNRKLRHDLDNILSQMLQSTIFLGIPIEYEKKTYS